VVLHFEMAKVRSAIDNKIWAYRPILLIDSLPTLIQGNLPRKSRLRGHGSGLASCVCQIDKIGTFEAWCRKIRREMMQSVGKSYKRGGHFAGMISP
tara:strand:- start:208 stop:495 length:288 start_codon:yes stop_codon:yes gene_type:complete